LKIILKINFVDKSKFTKTHNADSKKAGLFNKNKSEWGKFSKTNINEFKSTNLLKQLENNKEEMFKQESSINKINQQIKNIIGVTNNQTIQSSNSDNKI